MLRAYIESNRRQAEDRGKACSGCGRICDPHIFSPRTETDFFNYTRIYGNTHCYLLEPCRQCRDLFCETCMPGDDNWCPECVMWCPNCGAEFGDPGQIYVDEDSAEFCAACAPAELVKELEEGSPKAQEHGSA